MVSRGNLIVGWAISATFQVSSCCQERSQMHTLSLGFSFVRKIVAVQKESDISLYVLMSPVIGIKKCEMQSLH